METYEKYKMLTYLANAMSDRRFLRDNLARIVDWHGGFGYRLFSADAVDLPFLQNTQQLCLQTDIHFADFV